MWLIEGMQIPHWFLTASCSAETCRTCSASQPSTQFVSGAPVCVWSFSFISCYDTKVIKMRGYIHFQKATLRSFDGIKQSNKSGRLLSLGHQPVLPVYWDQSAGGMICSSCKYSRDKAGKSSQIHFVGIWSSRMQHLHNLPTPQECEKGYHPLAMSQTLCWDHLTTVSLPTPFQSRVRFQKKLHCKQDQKLLKALNRGLNPLSCPTPVSTR